MALFIFTFLTLFQSINIIITHINIKDEVTNYIYGEHIFFCINKQILLKCNIQYIVLHILTYCKVDLYLATISSIMVPIINTPGAVALCISSVSSATEISATEMSAIKIYLAQQFQC